MSAGQRSYGPSWGEVAELQGQIQAAYGGFCVIQARGVPHYSGRPKMLWFCKWAPTLGHAHLAHYRGASGYYPAGDFPTVPALLMSLLGVLDAALRGEEERRRVLGMCRLREIELPTHENWLKTVT